MWASSARGQVLGDPRHIRTQGAPALCVQRRADHTVTPTVSK